MLTNALTRSVVLVAASIAARAYAASVSEIWHHALAVVQAVAEQTR